MTELLTSVLRLAQTSLLPALFLKSTVILMIANAVVLLLRQQAAAIRYWIWNLALISLIFLPILSVIIPEKSVKIVSINFRQIEKIVEPSRLTGEKPASESEQNQFTPEESPVMNHLTSKNNSHSQWKEEKKTANPFANSKSKQIKIDWFPIFLFVWVAGIVIHFAFLILSFASTWWRARKGTHLKIKEWQESIQRNSIRLSVTTPIKIVIHSKILVPAIFGWFKPVLLLPETAPSWSADKRNIVIVHELAHLKRKDFFANLIIQVVCIFYWVNPLVWFALRQCRNEQENACDDYVLRDGIESCDYARCLVEIARSLAGKRFSEKAAISMAHHSDLKNRVEKILSPKLPRNICHSKYIFLSVVMLIFVILPLTIVKLQGKETEKKFEWKHPSSYSQLWDALKNGSDVIQVKAAWALGDLEKEQAVPALIEALNDKAPKVRAMAAWALGEIKDENSLTVLLAALDEPDDFACEMIVKAIGELEIPQAVEPLKEKLNHRNPDIRFAAVWALGEIRTMEATEAITSMLDDANPLVKKMALKTLQAPKDWASGATSELYPILSDFDIDEVEKQVRRHKRREMAIEELSAELKNGSPESRILTAYSLGRIGSPKALDPLLAALNDENVEVRFVAVWALDELEGH